MEHLEKLLQIEPQLLTCRGGGALLTNGVVSQKRTCSRARKYSWAGEQGTPSDLAAPLSSRLLDCSPKAPICAASARAARLAPAWHKPPSVITLPAPKQGEHDTDGEISLCGGLSGSRLHGTSLHDSSQRGCRRSPFYAMRTWGTTAHPVKSACLACKVCQSMT